MGIVYRDKEKSGRDPDRSHDETVVCTVTEQYGLYVGPEGGEVNRAGIQCRARKWSYLFKKDRDDTPNLVNLVEWLLEESEDKAGLKENVDDFVRWWIERRKANGLARKAKK